MIIIGVDPGSNVTGWGVVERKGPHVLGVAAGVIKAGRGKELHLRLKAIYEGLCDAIDTHQPQAMAVEDIFHAKFARSALVLGQARGVCLLAGANHDLPIAAYPPTLVKRSVAGRGMADKSQIARVVGAMLKLKTLPPIDATDALAVAITHANATRMGTRLPRA